MRVLVACEYSGRVRDAFRALGHEAMSCDLLPTDVPGPHYMGDVRDVLYDGWDLMVAHPPCTYLTIAAEWCYKDNPGKKMKPGVLFGAERRAAREEALEFFRLLLDAPIPHIAVENPVGVVSSRIRKPDQTIQPWQFGHDASKATCLWLKNLPPLVPTEVVHPRLICCGNQFDGDAACQTCNGTLKPKKRWANQTDSGQNRLPPSADRWKIRSETYVGVAKAMATQWDQVVFADVIRQSQKISKPEAA
ncbi:hypothetical protein BFM99_14270 [Stutzerimonas stutzeri]|nr:hypothetical protein BFM99_14270 [Stutzerimonas stutzeri]